MQIHERDISRNNKWDIMETKSKKNEHAYLRVRHFIAYYSFKPLYYSSNLSTAMKAS